jgi:hypothetical protein
MMFYSHCSGSCSSMNPFESTSGSGQVGVADDRVEAD